MSELTNAKHQLHAIDETVEIDGVRLNVRRMEMANASGTIVFLHDSLGCIPVWRDFPERLCAAVRMNGLIYDRQGYGGSSPFSRKREPDYLELEADVCAKLMQKFGISKSVLFGHSDGGSIALIVASKTPDLVAGVISEGAHVFVEDITLEGIRQAQKLFAETDLRERIRKYHGDNTDGVISAWIDTWLSAEFQNFNMEHFLPGIKCPLLAIQGTGDEYGSEAQVDAIVGQASGPSAKDMIKFARHTPHKEAVEYTLNAVSTFIRGIQTA